MTNKLRTALFCIFPLLSSCQNRVGITRTSLQADTVVSGEKFLLFGRDSARCVLSNGNGMKIVYTMDIPDNGVHYKIRDAVGILREIAYARHIPLAFDSVDYYATVMYPHPDSIVQFYDNGAIRTIGFAEYRAEDYRYASRLYRTVENGYDSTGILIERTTATMPGIGCFIRESYHRNGQMKEKYIQGYAYASGACLGTTEWDSLGHKTKECRYDYKVSEWGESYNHRFCVETITEYYPDGKVKRINKIKSFEESDECPCGQWVYYDETGLKVHAEQHKPCDNFLIDCETTTVKNPE